MFVGCQDLYKKVKYINIYVHDVYHRFLSNVTLTKCKQSVFQ